MEKSITACKLQYRPIILQHFTGYNQYASVRLLPAHSASIVAYRPGCHDRFGIFAGMYAFRQYKCLCHLERQSVLGICSCSCTALMGNFN